MARVHRFGQFELDPEVGEIRTTDSTVTLQEKPVLLLLALLENPHRLVTRAQLRERMWPADTFVDYEQGINVAIKKVRDALDDSADSPRFIETIPKKGYRFLVDVEVLDKPAAAPVLSQAAAVAVRLDVPARGTLVSPRLWLFAFAMVALLAALGAWRFRSRPIKQSPRQFSAIAVLPLRNLSPDANQEYLSDGITEELITDLAQSLPLRVISRTSVMHYKETSEPMPQIARELGVDVVIEGAVTRAGDRVTITVQLIDATQDRHLWAQKYERHRGDLLEIESEVSQEIARQVSGTLGVPPRIKSASAHAVDPRAYDLYLQARFFWNKRTNEGVMKAAQYFQNAVDIDPKYAQAYVGLADCYLFGQPPTEPPDVLASNAKALVQKALEIDDRIGEAHATLGLLAQNHDWNWAEAEREYKRAIELNPNYATAHQWYGGYLALSGRFDDALDQMRLANQLDPLSLATIKDTGETYYVARRYDRAIEYFHKALEMDPDFILAHRSLGLTYLQKREFSPAIAEFRRAQQLEDSPDGRSDLGYAYAVSGRRREAQQILTDLAAMSERRYVLPDGYAAIYAGLGNKDRAFEWLETAYRERGLLTGLKVDPRWDSLRGDSRFADLMKRVGLAQ